MQETSPLCLGDLPEFADLPGGDLVWWRDDAEWHTLVSIDCSIESNNHLKPGTLAMPRLLLVWTDSQGSPLDAQQIRVQNRSHLVLDSRKLATLFGRPVVTAAEGVLVIVLWPDAPADKDSLAGYSRLYVTVDWHSEAGQLISLHSDQSFRKIRKAIDLTEMVVRETTDSRNSLIFVNGPARQSPGALLLNVTNHRGEVLEARYNAAMPPFSLHRLRLATLFPDIEEFGAAKHLMVGGHFDCDSLYTRPYVITEGVSAGGYHGGDRYEFSAVPGFAHRLLGRGETNPMLIVEGAELSTTVNVLNSHGGVEGDFWVDAHVYDRSGALVAVRERWLLARRFGLSRGHVKDLLENAGPEFVGHLCLSYSKSGQALYPKRLQALMEYAGRSSVARVMAWSDLWNARERVAEILGSFDARMKLRVWGEKDCPEPGRLYSSHYRAWCGDDLETWLAVTNAGTLENYSTTIAYDIELTSVLGQMWRCSRCLPPFATDLLSLSEIFPRARDLLGDGNVGMLRVVSAADLACVQLTQHRRSGAWGVEHLMADASLFNGEYRSASGS